MAVKSLADRIRAKKKENINLEDQESEKELVEGFNNPEETKPFNQNSRSGQGQGQVNSVSDKDQLHIRHRSDKGQVKRLAQGQVKVKSKENPQKVGSGSTIRSVSGQGQVKKIRLADKQAIIYNWFLKNGLNGEFNKPQISKDTGINHPTIRKAIDKLESVGIIQLFEYDFCSRTQEYKINPDIAVEKPKSIRSGSNIRSVSGHDQVGIRSDPLISSSSPLNKTDLLARISEMLSGPLLEFWVEYGLKPAKIKKWIEETEMTLQEMEESLLHCRFEMQKNGCKDKHGQPIKDMLSWFYKRIIEYRYYEKPSGYLSPVEKQIQDRLKRTDALEAELKKLRETRQRAEDLKFKIWIEKLTDEEANEFLKENKILLRRVRQGNWRTSQPVLAGLRKIYDDQSHDKKK